jgi:hypothetical protein
VWNVNCMLTIADCDDGGTAYKRQHNENIIPPDYFDDLCPGKQLDGDSHNGCSSRDPRDNKHLILSAFVQVYYRFLHGE